MHYEVELRELTYEYDGSGVLLWKEHDAHTKALDRLLRDLRVEKA